MPLDREDVCRHFVDGAFFKKCLVIYTGSSGEYRRTWEVCVCSHEMPEGQQENPTHGQIVAVADQKAIPLYEAWLTTLPNTEDEHEEDGIGGNVVP